MHGLRVVCGKLVLHGKSVLTITLCVALIGLYEFLCIFNRKCILVAHNCSFDYRRLMGAMQKVFMQKQFHAIIYGYANSRPIIKMKTNKKKKSHNKLENFAREFNINCNKAHDALYDVVMLDLALNKSNITDIDLISSSISWDEAWN